jgi:hypothetical protein
VRCLSDAHHEKKTVHDDNPGREKLRLRCLCSQKQKRIKLHGARLAVKRSEREKKKGSSHFCGLSFHSCHRTETTERQQDNTSGGHHVGGPLKHERKEEAHSFSFRCYKLYLRLRKNAMQQLLQCSMFMGRHRAQTGRSQAVQTRAHCVQTTAPHEHTTLW